MKIVFYSNFLNHHQESLCNNLFIKNNGNFRFIQLETMPNERKELGYMEYSDIPYLLKVNDNGLDQKELLEISKSSDLVIFGSSSEKYIKSRSKLKKMSFIYSERIFKSGYWHILSPRFAKYLYGTHYATDNSKTLLLCASAYAARDFSIIGTYKNRTYKWGYFPKFVNYNIQSLIDLKPKNEIRIIWVGRLINWKHPELIIEVADYLRNSKICFEIDMIGSGILFDKLNNKIQKMNLSKFIKMHGSMDTEEVRFKMERSNIFIFTSDYNEGWGAVLNEAMNSGCAVVASHAIGSVPFLLKHKFNGLIYENGNTNDLLNKVLIFINNPEIREFCSLNAYRTISETWNADIASTRLLELSKALIQNEILDYEDGPCSIAKNISQRKMYSYLMKNKNI